MPDENTLVIHFGVPHGTLLSSLADGCVMNGDSWEDWGSGALHENDTTPRHVMLPTSPDNSLRMVGMLLFVHGRDLYRREASYGTLLLAVSDLNVWHDYSKRGCMEITDYNRPSR